MINTYVYSQPMNNISHVITGQGGNTVRFNFTNGNVITKKLPELTLRGKYYQDLLESSSLFKNGLVRKVLSVEESSDKKETNNKEEGKNNVNGMEEILSVTTTDEIIAYVNERFGKDCRTLATAMKHASANNLIFPNYQP